MEGIDDVQLHGCRCHTKRLSSLISYLDTFGSGGNTTTTTTTACESLLPKGNNTTTACESLLPKGNNTTTACESLLPKGNNTTTACEDLLPMSIIEQQVARDKIFWQNVLATCEKQNPPGKTFSQPARSKIPSAKHSRSLRECFARVKLLSQPVVEYWLMVGSINQYALGNTPKLCMLFLASLQIRVPTQGNNL
jgi:hypothetical protein